jgi:EmrB/QacA subfamily drug resistance transporter
MFPDKHNCNPSRFDCTTNTIGHNRRMPVDPERRTQIWVLVATIIASGMSFITTTSIGVLLPAMQRELELDGAQMIWVANAYTLFLSSLILVGGALGDRLGRKRVFMAGIGLFALASIACGLATGGNQLIVARGIQGVGAALMVPTSLAVLSASFPPERRGRAIGLWSTFTSASIALGPALGGVLAGAGLWRLVFFLNVFLAVVALAAARQISPMEPVDRAGRIDWLGAVLVTLGLALLTLGFSQGPGRGWGNPLVVGALISGVAALMVFVLWQKRGAHPLLPLELFRSATFSGGNLLTLFLYMALQSVFFFLPLNLIQIQGYPESLAGLTTLPFIILLTVLSPWAGTLVDKIGPRLPLIAGPLLAGGGMILMGMAGLTGGPADYWLRFFPGIALVGVGMGLTVAPLTTAVMKAAPDERAGAASGINNAVANTAGVLAVAVLGALALAVFARLLGATTAELPLSEAARQSLQVEAGKLAGATVPPMIGVELAGRVQAAIDLAFANTFRVVMLAAGGLAWFGALISALLIRND